MATNEAPPRVHVKGAGRKKESPYQRWLRDEGVPSLKGSYVADLHVAEVHPWPRIGQKGAIINLADQELDDCWLIEIAPAGKTEPLHHAFEAGIYVLEGRGGAEFWQANSKKRQAIEWGPGSLFAPPLNCHYQLYNADGKNPARLFMCTNAPTIINLYRDPDFAFNNPYVFTDRYNAEDDYFLDHGARSSAGNFWETNFVPNLHTFRRDEYLLDPTRGGDSAGLNFMLSGNSMFAGNTVMPIGTYKKAHRHGVGAHLLILEGQGNSLMWFEGQEAEPTRVDWTHGTLISPRYLEYHQHFNTGATPAMYFKFRLAGLDPHHGEWARHTASGDLAEENAGIPYEREAPRIYEAFVEECRRNGATVMLPKPHYV